MKKITFIVMMWFCVLFVFTVSYARMLSPGSSGAGGNMPLTDMLWDNGDTVLWHDDNNVLWSD